MAYIQGLHTNFVVFPAPAPYLFDAEFCKNAKVEFSDTDKSAAGFSSFIPTDHCIHFSEEVIRKMAELQPITSALQFLELSVHFTLLLRLQL
jgi:hypothetical protein